MDNAQVQAAAATLWNAWRQMARLDRLPEGQRPSDRKAGYAIQAAIERASGQGLFGWKIAATSAAGQQHIGVEGPFAGRLLSGRVRDDGAAISMGGNLMRVAEAEFAFRMSRDLPLRETPYGRDEVAAAVSMLYPAIEIPDSRYREFAKVGALQLIADNACASYFVLGPATRADFRRLDLASHPVKGYSNGQMVKEGSGANVLGDPWVALTWIANELATYGDGLKAGQVVTTGTCVVPFAIKPGDHALADFGELGTVECRLVA
jgi:2-keto-4-pentenoate hydratase